MTIVDELALLVFVSWGCTNIKNDNVYSPRVTVTLKAVEYKAGFSYVEDSFRGTGYYNNNGYIHYNFIYQYELDGITFGRIVEGDIFLQHE